MGIAWGRANQRLTSLTQHFAPATPTSTQEEDLRVSPTLGELENLTKDTKSTSRYFRFRYERHALKIWYQEEEIFKERYGGAHGIVVLEGELIKPNTKSETVLVFMHPIGIQNMLPLPIALARSGLHVATCTSRYPNNDTALIMEKVILDLGACIRHLKEKYHYKKVVLAGWSGGGALSCLYQSQAESPSITCTPAGESPDLTKANLIPADGLMCLAAHVSRAKTLTEWLDASIIDENNPTKKLLEFDLYNPKNPNQPPYTPEFVRRYRQAQIDRNRRITKWVKEQLAELKQRNDGEMEKCFVVQGTMADPRWLDLSVDPNGRKGPNWCFLGIPKTVNNSPVGLARFCSLRTWLSQWSYDDSNADGPTHIARVRVPVMVVGNTDDDGVPASHVHALYNAISHNDKELYFIKDANHYYAGQPEKQAECCGLIIHWLVRRNLLDRSEIILPPSA